MQLWRGVASRGGSSMTTTMMQTWLHKADPTYSRARPKNQSKRPSNQFIVKRDARHSSPWVVTVFVLLEGSGKRTLWEQSSGLWSSEFLSTAVSVPKTSVWDNPKATVLSKDVFLSILSSCFSPAQMPRVRIWYHTLNPIHLHRRELWPVHV